MKPSVLVGGKLPASVMARLEEACDVDRVEGGAPTHDELIARIPGKQALVAMITNTVDRALLEAGRDLRVVANVAVGYNNIDVAAARERGIVVTNTPDVLTEATADFTWALILGITRRLGEGERLVRRGGWKGWAFDFMLATELRGKQLGIVGYGRIGRAVAARAAAFGMPTSCTRRVPTHRASVRGGDPGSGGGMPLDRLLSTSDVVSLHVPLTADTTHLIDQPALARMKRTAYSDQHLARPGRRRSRARLGAEEPADRRRRARRLRAGADRAPGPADARERSPRAAHGQRHDRDADRDGRSCRAQCHRRAQRTAAADACSMMRASR